MAVSTDELPERLRDLAEEADHEVIQTEDETFRFKPDPLYSLLMDVTDLNELWVKAGESGEITVEDMKEFYQKSGYSLEGYWEIFSGEAVLGEKFE
jgi:hypothetical protein